MLERRNEPCFVRSDGLGYGNNGRAALITRGLVEISRIALKLGANPLTLSGLAGMGDLVLTCTGNPLKTYQYNSIHVNCNFELTSVHEQQSSSLARVIVLHISPSRLPI